MIAKKPKVLKVKLYDPHSGQMHLHNCPVRFRVMCCGRRFGKTLAATNELAKKALEKSNTLNWWIAPTYRQTEIAFNLLVEALEPVMAKKPNHTKMRIDLINGSIIECRSAERYENLRGDGPSFVVFDEASKCPEKAWTEVVRPSLADNEGGAIFISTPWGRDWFYDLFLRGQDPSETEWWSKSFPTSANPFIPEKEIAEAKRTLPELVFEQEFMARFLDDAASVFRRVDSCIADTLRSDPEYGHNYVVGWDVAKYTDYSVCTVIDVQTRKVVELQRFHGMEYTKQIDNILVPLVHKWNNAHTVMDMTGVGDPVLEQVNERDISVEGYYFTNTSKKQLIDRTVVAIEQRQVQYPNNTILIEELKSYGYEFTKSGNIIYNAPEGKHDDCVISLALAVYAAKIGGVVPFSMSNSTGLLIAEEPKILTVDDAFIMRRQEQMAKSLNYIKEGAAVVKIEGNSGWGIA